MRTRAAQRARAIETDRRITEEDTMVEKTIDLTGQSSTSIEAAVNLAVSRAAVTITDIRQARVTDIVALVKDGEVANWRVDLRLTFRVSDRVHE